MSVFLGTALRAESPIVPGLTRPGVAPRARGAVLLGELGCAHCHSTRLPSDLVAPKRAPRLADVGSRVQASYLRRFLSSPGAVKPGTTMPDVLAALGNGPGVPSRQSAAEALTHFLVRESKELARPEDVDHVAAARGRELYHDIGCVACHSPRNEDGADLLPETSVPLVDLHRKYSVSSLTSFLENPHEVRPSGRMPSLHLSPVESYQLANYLVRETRVPARLRYTLYRGAMEEGPEKLDGKEVRGGVADGFDLRGLEREREDFAVRFDGYLDVEKDAEFVFELATSHFGRLRVDGKSVIALSRAGTKRAILRLESGVRRIEVLFLHVRGEPRLELRMKSGPDANSVDSIPPGALHALKQRVLGAPVFSLDPAKAELGKELFAKLRCAACHESGQEAAAATGIALTEISRSRGCVSETTGPRPSYRLSDAQVEELAAAVSASSWKPTAEEKIGTRLTALNCIACHPRGELGGVSQERNGYYRSVDENLAEPGRIPPPLTGVGAKLQEDWLRKTLARGQRLRPYMNMRMPIFGDEAVDKLADWILEVDRLPSVDFAEVPRGRDPERAFREVGRKLVGDRGMNCIACHTFRGQGSSTMAAIDIIETTTRRLRKDWFYHYMLEPARFRASTIMPQFFPGGESIFPSIGDGDAKSQLNAMWYYLSQGRNTSKPSGLRRPPMEIVVGDEAVIIRRSAQGTGKRAISVGYPLKVSIVFDAESVGLQQIWRGQFVDPVGIWTGQGSGAVRVLSRDRVVLSQGAPFAELEDETAPWPTTSSRDLGIRFKGYDLDALRRPTFFYVFGDTRVSDKPEDVAGSDGSSAFLRRTIRLTSRVDRRLFFHAARGEKLVALEDGSVRIDDRLVASAKGGVGSGESLEPRPLVVRPAAKGLEAILAVPVQQGGARLVLEYRFTESSR